MTGTLEALTKLSANHGRNIQQIRAIQDDNDEEDLFADDSSVDEGFTNATNPALVRNKMKTHPRGVLKTAKRRRR